MTRYFLDSREISIPFDVSSIDQILKHVEDFHLSPNTVVRQVQIDGLPLMPGSDEQSGLLCGLEERDRVEVFTGSMKEIAHDSIDEACRYLGRVEAAIPSISVTFQNSPGQDAFENLRQMNEGLYWLTLLLDKLKINFHMRFEDTLIQGIPVYEHHQKFISILKQLIDSQERKDFVLISDLLQYEVYPLVPVWREMFRIMLEKVDSAQ